jgi:hypothetical protein
LPHPIGIEATLKARKYVRALLLKLPLIGNLASMRESEVAVATITLARTASEEKDLISALKILRLTELPAVIADGGSPPAFLARVKELGFTLTQPKARGLVPQVKASLREALKRFPDKRFILYTEPDKYPFFEGPMMRFIAKVRPAPRLAVALAARNTQSFRTFPKGQFTTESFMNEAFSWFVGEKGDYCYGPLLLSRRAAEMALESPDDLGWGWRFWTMARATAARLRVLPIEMNLPCPKSQRAEDSMGDRTYRLRQLGQNLKAIEMAAS